ncbi:agouti-signaling protein-like isoform X2 [Antennarius striatus]|uniref:agouti-signaling protein-like isoform X2 n=1 Tax=Antennarius striatus TaxID=241820 RepID=UPI0035B1B53B
MPGLSFSRRSLDPVDSWLLPVVGPDEVFLSRGPCFPRPRWRGVNRSNLRLLRRASLTADAADPPIPARIGLVNARSLANKTFILKDFFTSRGCFGNRGSTRPLFARRGHYEQQRIQMQKPKLVPVLRKNPPTPSNVPPKPVKPKCSHLTQTCVPQSGCCDPVASCHCRFFKAICFCRRTNSLSIKKS